MQYACGRDGKHDIQIGICNAITTGWVIFYDYYNIIIIIMKTLLMFFVSKKKILNLKQFKNLIFKSF